MEIGKQSNLNDLLALKAYLETQIAAAATVQIGQVSQIESGNLLSGSIYDVRPTGVYKVAPDVSDKPAYDLAHGMMLYMYSSDLFNSSFYIDWGGSVAVSTKVGTDIRQFSLLSTKNTITDSNGFIKAA